MKKLLFFVLVLFSLTTEGQTKPRYYFKDNEMGSFPLALKSIANYSGISEQFTYFSIDEQMYNATFYKSFVNENGNQSKFFRMDLVFPRKIEIQPIQFPNYKLVLNPKLEKGFFSKHRFLLNVREESASADFETDAVEWEFPETVLRSKSNTPSKALVELEHVEFHNDGSLNRFHGIILKGIKGFTLEPSVIPGSFIELTNTKEGEFQFLSEEAYVYPNLVFENNKLCRFLNKYGHINPSEYKSAIELKDVQGKINLGKEIQCEVSEIYFFENNIAGVLTFPVKEREGLLQACNYMKRNTANWSGLKLKDGKIPSFAENYLNTTVFLEEDFKTIKMYFFIKK